MLVWSEGLGLKEAFSAQMAHWSSGAVEYLASSRGLESELEDGLMPTAVRVAKMGAKAGLGFGVLQDGVSLLRGRRLGYVEFVKRHAFGRDGGEVKLGGVG